MTAARWEGDCLLLACHLQPGAKHDGFVGLHGEAVKIRIAAPPIEGRANSALIAFLATSFGVRKQDVTVIAGELSRQKRVSIRRPQRWPDIPGLEAPARPT